MKPLLEARHLSKRFGGLQALSDVSFTIWPGRICGLIGPNGAGKTTLFNVLTGLYVPEEGECLFAGKNLVGVKPHEIAALGMARTFQNIRLFANLTVLENVMIGCHVRTHGGLIGAILRTRRTRREEADIVRRAYALLEYTGIAAHANAIAKSLSYGDQRRLEIARALATEPCLLALDEPAAGMNASETLVLRRLIKAIRSDYEKMSVLVIEHDMKFIMSLCDDMVVLDYGKVLARGKPAEIQRNEKVIEAYLGPGAVQEHA